MILIDALSRLAATTPHGVALGMEGGSVTFADLESQVRRMAGWLWREGLRPGDMAGLTVRDEHAHLVTSLALMRLGCSQVTLPSHEPEAMRSALAGRCGVACVICGGADGRLPGTGALEPAFADIFADASPGAPAPVHDATPLVLMPSSGTTGRAKLIHCTQRQIFGYGLSHLPEPAVLYRLTSIESNIGKWSHLGNLARGRTLVFCDPDRMPLAEICRRFGVTQVNMSAVKAAALLRGLDAAGPEPAFPGIRFVLGGSPVPGALRQEILRRLSGQLYVMYGATECGLASSAGPQTHAGCPDGVGHPLPGVEIGIVDESGAPLPAGEVGHVRIRSQVSATSYYDDPDATSKFFKDGWFHPGDLGSMTPDGMLVFSGRADDMMILNTINIFPSEIEAVAGAFPGVQSCAAFPIRSAAYGDIPLLAVVAGQGFDPASLLAHCREKLGLRSPRKIVQVESIPRNATGKVLRRELQARFGGNA